MVGAKKQNYRDRQAHVSRHSLFTHFCQKLHVSEIGDALTQFSVTTFYFGCLNNQTRGDKSLLLYISVMEIRIKRMFTQIVLSICFSLGNLPMREVTCA